MPSRFLAVRSLQATSAADGTYTVTHVDPAVKYLDVVFACASPGYEVQYYDNVSTAALATPDQFELGVSGHRGERVASLMVLLSRPSLAGRPTAAPPARPDNHFSFKANVAGSTFKCSLDGGKFKSAPRPTTRAALAAGQSHLQR